MNLYLTVQVPKPNPLTTTERRTISSGFKFLCTLDEKREERGGRREHRNDWHTPTHSSLFVHDDEIQYELLAEQIKEQSSSNCTADNLQIDSYKLCVPMGLIVGRPALITRSHHGGEYFCTI